MNKSNVSKFVKGMKMSMTKHSPEILTGFGIAGMLATTALAVKATPKAIRIIEEEKEATGEETLSTIDTVKLCWKCYIPATVTCVTSIGCLIGASSVNAKRNAALAAAYTLSDTAFREYREKVVETIGEKKEKTVKDKVAEERISKDPVTKKEIYITEKGNTLCYDAISGRYFKSDIEKIKKAVNDLNKMMLRDMCISLNEFYDEIGLEHTTIGEELGWNLDNGLIELDFSSQLTDDGTPCLVLDYHIAPKYNFYKFA